MVPTADEYEERAIAIAAAAALIIGSTSSELMITPRRGEDASINLVPWNSDAPSPITNPTRAVIMKARES